MAHSTRVLERGSGGGGGPAPPSYDSFHFPKWRLDVDSGESVDKGEPSRVRTPPPHSTLSSLRIGCFALWCGATDVLPITCIRTVVSPLWFVFRPPPVHHRRR